MLQIHTERLSSAEQATLQQAARWSFLDFIIVLPFPIFLLVGLITIINMPDYRWLVAMLCGVVVMLGGTIIYIHLFEKLNLRTGLKAGLKTVMTGAVADVLVSNVRPHSKTCTVQIWLPEERMGKENMFLLSHLVKRDTAIHQDFYKLKGRLVQIEFAPRSRHVFEMRLL